jgi:hypothetical protein
LDAASERADSLKQHQEPEEQAAAELSAKMGQLSATLDEKRDQLSDILLQQQKLDTEISKNRQKKDQVNAQVQF